METRFNFDPSGVLINNLVSESFSLADLADGTISMNYGLFYVNKNFSIKTADAANRTLAIDTEYYIDGCDIDNVTFTTGIETGSIIVFLNINTPVEITYQVVGGIQGEFSSTFIKYRDILAKDISRYPYLSDDSQIAIPVERIANYSKLVEALDKICTALNGKKMVNGSYALIQQRVNSLVYYHRAAYHLLQGAFKEINDTLSKQQLLINGDYIIDLNIIKDKAIVVSDLTTKIINITLPILGNIKEKNYSITILNGGAYNTIIKGGVYINGVLNTNYTLPPKSIISLMFYKHWYKI